MSELRHAIDIMPTLMEAAQVDRFDQKPMPFEGESLLRTITGEPTIQVERGPLSWAHNKGWAVRKGIRQK